MLLPDNSEYKPVEHPNMAPTRTVNGHLSVKERLGSYDEIDQTYTEEEAAVLRQQPGRVHGRAAEEATEGVRVVFVAKRFTNSLSSC